MSGRQRELEASKAYLIERCERAEAALAGLREAVLMTLKEDEFPVLVQIAREAEVLFGRSDG